MNRRIKNAKFIAYAYDADARLVGCEEDAGKLDLAAAAIVVGIRYPIPERPTVARRLRDIAGQFERREG